MNASEVIESNDEGGNRLLHARFPPHGVALLSCIANPLQEQDNIQLPPMTLKKY
jgi:hypothetical protein